MGDSILNINTMGYDLYVKRSIFIKEDTNLLSEYRKTKTGTLTLSETLFDLRGWDVSEIVQQYISEDTQELGADEIIDLYKSVCEKRGEEANKSLIDILQTDWDEHNHYDDGGVYYKLIQSY